jgi:diacylglycerol kinase (ATP)
LLNLHRNLKNSLAGIKTALSDKSFRGQIALGAVAMPVIVFFGTATIGHKLSAIGTYALLIAFELLNTAIEGLCDRVSKEYDQAIKEVKDMASAAVFVVLMLFLAQCAWILMGNP